MRFTLTLAVVGLLAAPTVDAQRTPPPAQTPTVQRTESRPAALRSPELAHLASVNGHTVEPDRPLTQEEILERISRVYRYQSEILQAQAQRDVERVDALFGLVMTELTRLARQPQLLDSPEGQRYSELYRAIVNEYERHYQVTPQQFQAQFGDIYEMRADMFAALDSDVALLENVTMPRLRQPAAAVIPMPMHPLVQNSVAFLLRNPDRHLNRWIERSETYFPMIEQIMEEEGAPDELKYLAMVESGLNPRAQSWAQAGGMWQFIQPTGAAYGLRVNEWVDERLDPEKATRAAARHLLDLHRMFGGDWHLALAGYNCSPARIRRALARAEARLGRKATFWDIYDDIPRETRNYVPMFIAAALLASNPDAVDRSRLTPGPRYTYAVAPIRGAASLRSLAELMGIEESVLRALNPELRRNTLPPSSEFYPLRVPLGGEQILAEALSGDAEVEVQNDVNYTVRRGDSLTRIAASHGVSEQSIREANNLRNSAVRTGQRLVIPMRSSTSQRIAMGEPTQVSYAVRPTRVLLADNRTAPVAPAITPTRTSTQAGPSISSPNAPVQTVSQRNAPAETPAPSVAPAASTRSSAVSNRTVYRVRSGDSLGRIAARYGVTVGQLRSWNNLSGSTIRAGQRLNIYTSGSEANETASAASAPAAAPAAAPATEAATTRHTVRRGENLSGIASRYGVTVDDLRSWNNLSGNNIQAGQRLVVSGERVSGSAPARSAPAARTTYTVRRGDTLSGIADRHNVTVRQLRDWNNLSGSNIRPGQRLKVTR